MNNKYIERLKIVKLNISYYRKLSGLSQEDLADKLNISRTHMGRVETPNSNVGVTLEMLFNIADVLNIDVCKLLEQR